MKTWLSIELLLLPAGLTVSCGSKNTSSHVETPGDDKTAKDKTLTAGADLLQDKNL